VLTHRHKRPRFKQKIRSIHIKSTHFSLLLALLFEHQSY